MNATRDIVARHIAWLAEHHRDDLKDEFARRFPYPCFNEQDWADLFTPEEREKFLAFADLLITITKQL